MSRTRYNLTMFMLSAVAEEERQERLGTQDGRRPQLHSLRPPALGGGEGTVTATNAALPQAAAA